VLALVSVAMVACGVFVEPPEGVAIALIVVGAGMFFISMLLPMLSEFQIGPAGFSAKLRERDAEVRASLEPQADSLREAAVGFADDAKGGEELLERALVETYLRWRQAKDEGPAEAVRKRLGEFARAGTLVAEADRPPASEGVS
jgi:hypothetical protein